VNRVNRRGFAVGLGAAAIAPLAVAIPSAARATGGMDIEGAVAPHTIRILLASGPVASPNQIDEWHFSWNGRSYRGTFAFVSLADGRTGLVNTAPLDAYLYGVMSKEVSPAWPRTSQHAQAIVARTYALGQLRPGHPYDLVASEAAQRYDGIVAETVEGRDAVDATSGSIVKYDGIPARVAYGSCCGGHTADGFAAWRSGAPYLRGVVDPYCRSTPAFGWNVAIPRSEVARAAGLDSLAAVALQALDSSGRAEVIALYGGRWVQVKGSEFRSMLGATRVRSTLIRSATVLGDNVLLSGNGFGHGVGLCQWGTRVMGQVGASSEQIVAFYFPGTSIGRG